MNLKRFTKYLAITRTQVMNGAAYPLDLATRSITMVLFMWIFAHLWSATYRAVGQDAIGGLTLRETLWYLMLAETIILSKSRLSLSIAEAVKEGSVAYLLNKPYNFMLYQISIAMGDGLTRIIFNVLAGGAVVWLMVGPPPAWQGIPFALVAVGMGWLIDSCFTAAIGLTAFLTEDVAAFDWIYAKLILILGGVLIPLDFFPDGLRRVAETLPFAYTVYGPARLFVTPDPARFVALVLGQVVWLALLAGAVGLLYRFGVTRLTINGG
ncbi:MAG: ABC transporter permease [Acidobacteriota bacterium]